MYKHYHYEFCVVFSFACGFQKFFNLTPTWTFCEEECQDSSKNLAERFSLRCSIAMKSPNKHSPSFKQKNEEMMGSCSFGDRSSSLYMSKNPSQFFSDEKIKSIGTSISSVPMVVGTLSKRSYSQAFVTLNSCLSPSRKPKKNTLTPCSPCFTLESVAPKPQKQVLSSKVQCIVRRS